MTNPPNQLSESGEHRSNIFCARVQGEVHLGKACTADPAHQAAVSQRPSLALTLTTCLGILSLGILSLVSTAQAVDYTWDPDAADGGIVTEGSGNWDTTTTNWTTDVGVTNEVGGTGSDPFSEDLIFGGGTAGTAGTVTLTETGNDYGSIEFLATNAGTYTIDLNGNEVELRRSGNTFLIGEDATITDIAGGGTLTLAGSRQFNFTDSSKTLSISAVIAGGGGTYSVGTGGTLDLSGVNTFTSALTLSNQSQLVISGAGQLGSGSYAGNITMNQGTDFTYASSADQTLSGIISDDGTGNGSNDVNVSGSGTLTLTGTNTYTGRTNISTTLEIQNSEALGTGLVVLTGGGELQFGADALDLSETVLAQNSGDNRTIRLDLAGTNTGTLSGQLDIRRNGAQLFDIDVGADDTLSVTSVIIGTGSAGLTKEGDGTLIIEANSTYTGATTVNGGTLEISATAAGNSPDSASYQINNGSTLFLNETTASNLILGVGIGDITFGSSDPGGTLQLNGNTIFRNQTITTTGGAKNFITGAVFNLQNTRNITFDTAVGTDVDGIDLEVSATISGGDIIKDGAGTVSLTNSANNLGTQNGGGLGEINTVTINAGTLEIGGAGRLVNGNYAGAISNAGIFKYNSTNAQELSGVISGAGSLEKDNTGTLTLSGANDYTGNTTVSAGILEVLTDSALGTAAGGTVVESGATLRLNSGANIASEELTLSGTLDGRTNGGDVEYGGAITLAANAEFFAGGSNSMTISGNVDGAGNQLTLNHATPTISITGNITGTNTSLVKVGTGTTTLSGTNTYTGVTTVSEGTLALNGAGANTTIAGDANIATFDVTIAGGTLRNDANEQIANDASITMSSGAFSLNGATETIENFTNSGGTFTTGAGTLIGLGNTITWSGGTNTINDGGTVQDTHWDVSGGTNIVEGGTTGGILHVQSGGTGFEFTGTGAPTITLNSDNATAGRILLEGDMIVAAGYTGSGATITSAAGGSNPGFIDLNGATRNFIINDSASAANDLSISAIITSAGGLDKSGAGTLLLSGVNTYTGNTTISAGTLEIGGAGQLGSGTYAGTISNSGTLDYNSSADQTLSGIISGTGDLEVNGAGTLTLSADNTYTGTTDINAGTLLINGDNSLANGALNILSTATLGGIGTIGGATTLNSDGFLSPGDGGADTLNFSALSSLDIQNASAGSLLFDLGAPGTSDLVAMATGAELTIASLSVADFIFTNLGSAAEGDYTLFTTANTAIVGIGSLNTTMNLISLSPSGPQFNARLSTGDFGIDGGQFIALTLSAVPEPSSITLLGLGLSALLLRRKRSAA